LPYVLLSAFDEILYRPDLHDALFKFVVGDEGFVFDPGLVGVDGIDGIPEDSGDLLVLMDARAGQGEDARRVRMESWDRVFMEKFKASRRI